MNLDRRWWCNCNRSMCMKSLRPQHLRPKPRILYQICAQNISILYQLDTLHLEIFNKKYTWSLCLICQYRSLPRPPANHQQLSLEDKTVLCLCNSSSKPTGWRSVIAATCRFIYWFTVPRLEYIHQFYRKNVKSRSNYVMQ